MEWAGRVTEYSKYLLYELRNPSTEQQSSLDGILPGLWVDHRNRFARKSNRFKARFGQALPQVDQGNVV